MSTPKLDPNTSGRQHSVRDVPGRHWQLGPANDVVDAAVNDLCADESVPATIAVVVVQHGRVIAERYQPDTSSNIFREGPAPETTIDTTMISWSMAKSFVHALVGFAVTDGLVQIDDPVPVPSWRGTAKAAITWQHLLNMRSGLDFNEDYVNDGISHVIDMLFGAGKDDVAGYAASRPLVHIPGSHWSYSSGDTNIVSRALASVVANGSKERMRAYVQERLFDPLGMASATAKFDDAGTFIGSSFVYATARDFARFGLLYLHDGWWGNQQILPTGWVDHARHSTPVPETESHGYGAHWWLWPYDGALACHGYEGQRMIVLPDRDAVVVRLGKTSATHNDQLRTRLHEVVRSIPTTEEPGGQRRNDRAQSVETEERP